MRSIGLSVSSAVIGMVLANTAHSVNGITVPTMRGFRVSFLIAAGAMALGLLTALFLPRARPHGQPRHRASNEEYAEPEPAETSPPFAGRPARTPWPQISLRTR